MKKQMTRITLCSAGAVAIGFLALAGSASAENPPKHKDEKKAEASATPASASKKPALSAKDKRFVNNAAKGGMMEVEWGKLAAQNGNHADVKKFGNRMVTDHSKANDELPGAKPAGKWKNDKDYMDMMVKDHEKDLAEFQAEAKDGTDADLKKFAHKGAKMVEHHLKMAKEIQGKLK